MTTVYLINYERNNNTREEKQKKAGGLLPKFSRVS